MDFILSILGGLITNLLSYVAEKVSLFVKSLVSQKKNACVQKKIC